MVETVRSVLHRSPIYSAISLLLIVAYFLFVLLLAPSAPFGDDKDITRSVEHAMAAANPWPDLWSLHNEHRLVTTKLAFWGQRALMGLPNYTMLAIIGNLLLLGIFAIFVSRVLKTASAAGATLLFVATMLFSYTSADSMLWAMAALSNYSVVLFALLAFWMLAKQGAGWLLGGLVCGLLACVSQGNGFVVLALGCVFLSIQRRWLSALIWAILLTAFLIAHFWDYPIASADSGPLSAIGRPGEVLLFALIFSGSALSYPTEFEPALFAMMAASAGLGLVIWGFVLRRLMSSRSRKSEPLLWFSIFLIASGFLAALGRMDFGLISATTPRYHIHSTLLIASCLLMLVSDEETTELGSLAKRLMPWFAAAGLAYVAASGLVLWRMHVFYVEQT